MALQRLLTGIQDPQDAKAFSAIGERSAPRNHAIEELAALIPQRLGSFEAYRLGFAFTAFGTRSFHSTR